MDKFDQRKKDVLGKIDKSSKGSWDSRIINLCEQINSMGNYYTTSSCSGKCVIIEEKVGKDGSYYLWESHELLDLNNLRKVISEISIKRSLIKFKLQSPIIYVVCRDLISAEKLFCLAREVGFKESGIHITKKLIGVEVRSGEKLEFPLFDFGEILVGDKFLNVLIKEANKKLKQGWEKLERLCQVVDRGH